MTVVVFGGPTITPDGVRQIITSAETLGPAACGDVYRAARRNPPAIVIIDGFFDHTLSVWHKEVLWAIEAGIRVYGAGSIGALRAAELAPFGMLGEGWVYEQFLDGTLEDDDEVAVVHAPREQGYAPKSDALVNLRTTLARAQADGCVSSSECALLTSELKRLFYPHRHQRALLQLARSNLAATDARRLEEWLDHHGITNQKRADAEQVLRRVVADLTEFPATRPPRTFRFERTDAWETLRARIDAETANRTPTGTHSPRLAGPRQNGQRQPDQHEVERQSEQGQPSDALAKLARAFAALEASDPELAQQLYRDALERSLALSFANRGNASVPPLVVQAASEQFRKERGLLTPEATARWLEANLLDVSTFSALIHDSVLVERFRHEVRAAVSRELLSSLRASGLLSRLMEESPSGPIDPE